MFIKIGNFFVISRTQILSAYKSTAGVKASICVRAFEGWSQDIPFGSQALRDKAWEQFLKDLGMVRNDDPYRNEDTSLASDEPTV